MPAEQARAETRKTVGVAVGGFAVMTLSNGKIAAVVLMILVGAARDTDASIWINEIDYDQPSTDTAEFVEMVVSPGMSINLADVLLEFYNGANGLVYDSVVGTSFSVGALVNGYQIYLADNAVIGPASNAIQNGAPDGLALSVGGVVQMFLSYEGSFTGGDGNASGMTSVDVGVADDGTFTDSLSLIGSGTQFSDFTWARRAPTPGSANTDQMLVAQQAIPEASSMLVWSALCGIVLIGWRRCRQWI
jgi:hypothetical protein